MRKERERTGYSSSECGAQNKDDNTIIDIIMSNDYHRPSAHSTSKDDRRKQRWPRHRIFVPEEACSPDIDLDIAGVHGIDMKESLGHLSHARMMSNTRIEREEIMRRWALIIDRLFWKAITGRRSDITFGEIPLVWQIKTNNIASNSKLPNCIRNHIQARNRLAIPPRLQASKYPLR